jgi:hypothetical protein
MLLEFIRSGRVTTNAAGVVDVVFTNQLPYGVTYVVILSLVDAGNTISAIASASNTTQTGFTINTRETKLTGGTYNQAPTIQVYWLVVPTFNS